jgi:L-aminopeptidase/D-esterase-like protein
MNLNITTNGSYPLISGKVGAGAGTSIVFISGTFGTSTAKLAYINSKGVTIDLVDGDVVAGSQYIIEHGSVIRPVLVVSAGSGIDAEVAVTSKV